MLEIITVDATQHDLLAHIKTLFYDYQRYLAISLDFQNFEAELADLPGKYADPSGRLYLALWNKEAAGCVAFYTMQPGICELKRLFVKPAYQGKSIGKALLCKAIQDAANMGFQRMRLDSMRRLSAAETMYRRMGFYDIEPYNHNPHPDVYYMEGVLSQLCQQLPQASTLGASAS